MKSSSTELFPHAPPFTIWQVIGVVFWYIVVQTIGAVVGLARIPGLADWSGQILSVLFVWYVVDKTSDVSFLTAYELKPGAAKLKQLLFTGFKYGFVLILIQILLIAMIAACITQAGQSLPSEPLYAKLFTWKDNTEFLSKYALVALAGPFNEELLARGLIFAGLRKNMTFTRACLISSALFGAAHIYPVHIAVAFSMGVMLCFAVERTRSLIPGLVCHVMLNSSVMFALVGVTLIHSPDSTKTDLKNDLSNSVQSVKSVKQR